jgi:hypothetical protein
MKLLDLLAKLGILRFGAKAAVYKSGTERPTELMMDGVFNAERDLVNQPKRGKGEQEATQPKR